MTLGSKPFSRRRVEQRFGCTYSEYLELRDRPDRPVTTFVNQRLSAKNRGVQWDLGLWEWWQIWDQSGHWLQRGRHAHAYCMCRKGDVGPYAVGNVFIAKFRENSSIHPNKKSDLPMGVFQPKGENCGYPAKRRINGKTVYLGTFATPELASAAYLASLQCEDGRA